MPKKRKSAMLGDSTSKIDSLCNAAAGESTSDNTSTAATGEWSAPRLSNADRQVPQTTGSAAAGTDMDANDDDTSIIDNDDDSTAVASLSALADVFAAYDNRGKPPREASRRALDMLAAAKRSNATGDDAVKTRSASGVSNDASNGASSAAAAAAVPPRTDSIFDYSSVTLLPLPPPRTRVKADWEIQMEANHAMFRERNAKIEKENERKREAKAKRAEHLVRSILRFVFALSEAHSLRSILLF